MNKQNTSKFLYLVSALLLIGFGIRLGADLYQYDSSYSAPFYLTVIVRAIEFVLPSAIIYGLARYVKRKNG